MIYSLLWHLKSELVCILQNIPKWLATSLRKIPDMEALQILSLKTSSVRDAGVDVSLVGLVISAKNPWVNKLST